MKLIDTTRQSRLTSALASPAFSRSVLCGAVLLAAAGHSSPTHAFTAGIECESSAADAVCRLSLLPGLTLESTVATTTEVASGEYRLEGTVVVVTPATRLPLTDSALSVSLGAEPEIHGETAVPLDRMPLLSEADFSTIPRAAIGLARGDTVEALVGEALPLNDAVGQNGSARDASKPYLLFHLDAGIAFSLPMEGAFEKLEDVTFTMPGSMRATAVLDLFDPYFYVAYSQTGGIDLEKMTRRADGDDGLVVHEIRDDDGELVMTFTIDPATGVMAEQNFVEDSVVYYERDANGDFVQQNVERDPVVLDGRQFESPGRVRDDDEKPDGNDDEEGGLPIDAIGFSANGWIPFVAETSAGMPADVTGFSGQLHLRGEIPLTTAVTIDGDVVTYVGERGLAQGGNGEVSLGVPGLPDFVDLSFHLGEASAAMTLTDTAQKVFVSGRLAPDTAFLADVLPILPSQDASVDGYVGNDIANTFLAVEGGMGLGADLLGDLIGVDLNELSLTRGRMVVDGHGFEVSGSTVAQISPDIRLGSAVEVYASMSWANPEDLSLTITGNMDVFGVALEDVTLEIGSAGLFVNGAFVTPVTRVALDGRITSAGPQLAGSGSIVLDMGAITETMRDAHEALTAAQAEVRRLDGAIASMRATVDGERATDREKLAKAQADLDAAKKVVDDLSAQIAAQHKSIAAHEAKIAAKYKWYKAAKWYEKATRYAAYVAEKSWRTAAIGTHYARIGVLEAGRVTARATLDAATLAVQVVEQGMIHTPVDLDPRVAALIVSKETALAALEVAKLPFRDIPFIDASVSGEIALSLGVDGLSGTVTASVGGATLHGTMNFDPAPRACVTVPTFGDACTPLL